MNPEELMAQFQQVQTGGVEGPQNQQEQAALQQELMLEQQATQQEQSQPTPQFPPGMEEMGGMMPGMEGMMPPQAPPSPQEAISQLLLEITGRKDLHVDVQSKAILTLAQAISQFNQQQQEAVPPQAQFELEVRKMMMEQQRIQEESEHKRQLAERELEHKLQMSQLKVEMEAQRAEIDSNVRQSQTQHQMILAERGQEHREKIEEEKVKQSQKNNMSKSQQREGNKG